MNRYRIKTKARQCKFRDKSYLPCLACRVIIFMLNPNFRFQTRRLCSQWLNYQHTDNTESGNIRRSPHSDGNLYLGFKKLMVNTSNVN